jgi:hypothetical protein
VTAYWLKRLFVIVGSVIVLLVTAGAGSAFAVQHSHDAAAKRKREAAAAAAEKKRAERSAAEAAKRAETAAEIADRHAAEKEMRASITKWAREQVASGLLDGPILRSSCEPAGGGSENLSEITVKYDCLAVTNDNADGTYEGYTAHATMNFSTGAYQWGLGNG